MRLTHSDRHRLSQVDAPDSETVRTALRNYMGVLDLTKSQFAEQIHRGESTMNLFLRGDYSKVAEDDTMIRKTVWDYLQRHPLAPAGSGNGARRARLFQTENYRRIRKYFQAACQHGEVVLLYGPPGTQKTFTLRHLIVELFRQKKENAVYVYASDQMPIRALFKRVGRELGIFVNLASNDRILTSILAEIGRRKERTVLVVDEAQHLDVHCLEKLREIYDRTEVEQGRPCGLVLAGSHNLYENFLRGRAQLEQWLSRIDHKDPLPGLLEDEVRQIAERELSNGRPAKLGERQLKALVETCRVDDIFARGADGKPTPVKYLSVRRLVKTLAQFQAAKQEPKL